MKTVDYGKITKFAIFPPLGIARVGSSNNYYVGAEISEVYVGEGDPSFKFKDEEQRIRPQAARFRIYGYDKDDNVIGEIKLTDGVDVRIVWTVELANKKASHKKFDGDKDLRNDWAKGESNRKSLEAVKENSLSSSNKNEWEKEFNVRVYSTFADPDSRHVLYLGKMIMEKEGSLIIIGGKGKSDCVQGGNIAHFADNDYWHDDTSDGSIDAKVSITVNGQTKDLTNREGKSWVLVAPPKYAPGIPNLVSLYQVIWETQHPVSIDTNKAEYYRDIRPIFDAVCKNSWVKKNAFDHHGPGKNGDFLKLEDNLKDPSKKEDFKKIFDRVRIPEKFPTESKRNGTDRNKGVKELDMPPLSGDKPDTSLTVTPGQYLNLQKWFDGNFAADELYKPIKYNYQFNSDGQGRYPKYGNEQGDYKEFEEIITNASDQVEHLKKSPLVWCVGGGFHPGIEMTFIANDKTTFSSKYDFRINDKVIKPGDINAYMALPWQADFNACARNWWPAQRPDDVITEKKLNEIIKRGNNKISSVDFEDWARKDSGTWENYNDMVNSWNKLGFVIEKKINNDMKVFTEIEHG